MSLCKDTNFKANHNLLFPVLFVRFDVCLCAKIRILKQITTKTRSDNKLRWCLSLCKDTNFKANHNSLRETVSCTIDVCLCAKIRILKQITTTWHCYFLTVDDVCLCAKIRILKQITTFVFNIVVSVEMFVFVQRYEF